MSTNIRHEIAEFTKESLEKRLKRLTPDQLDRFNRIFKGGVRDKDILNAIDLVDRTIAINRYCGKCDKAVSFSSATREDRDAFVICTECREKM